MPDDVVARRVQAVIDRRTQEHAILVGVIERIIANYDNESDLASYLADQLENYGLIKRGRFS